MSLSGSFEGKATRFPAAGGFDDHRPRLLRVGVGIEDGGGWVC